LYSEFGDDEGGGGDGEDIEMVSLSSAVCVLVFKPHADCNLLSHTNQKTDCPNNNTKCIILND
jgi:hypothetical protein